MASKFDQLIDSLFTDTASRGIATDFVMRHQNEPMMEGRIEPLLREAALANQRVANGEIAPEQGRSYLSSFAAEGLGTPAHLVAAWQEWADGVGAQQAEE